MKTFLEVKRFYDDAILPTVAHPGEDLAYDVYTPYPLFIGSGFVTVCDIGVAVRAFEITSSEYKRPLGLIVKDRSSIASKGIFIHGGVIDPGYTGELRIIFHNSLRQEVTLPAGSKIAQIIPVRSYTGDIVEVEGWEETSRGGKGFGSSGA